MTLAEATFIVFYWDGTAMHLGNNEIRPKLWRILDALEGWRPVDQVIPILDEMIAAGKGGEKVQKQVREIKEVLLEMEAKKNGR